MGERGTCRWRGGCASWHQDSGGGRIVAAGWQVFVVGPLPLLARPSADPLTHALLPCAAQAAQSQPPGIRQRVAAHAGSGWAGHLERRLQGRAGAARAVLGDGRRVGGHQVGGPELLLSSAHLVYASELQVGSPIVHAIEFILLLFPNACKSKVQEHLTQHNRRGSRLPPKAHNIRVIVWLQPQGLQQQATSGHRLVLWKFYNRTLQRLPGKPNKRFRTNSLVQGGKPLLKSPSILMCNTHTTPLPAMLQNSRHTRVQGKERYVESAE